MQSTIIRLEMSKKKTNHILHLILSLLTGGLWIAIWLLVGISNSLENSRLDRKIRKAEKEAMFV